MLSQQILCWIGFDKEPKYQDIYTDLKAWSLFQKYKVRQFEKA